jgi:hypothetical protein
MPGPSVTNRCIYFSGIFLSQVANKVMAHSGKVQVSLPYTTGINYGFVNPYFDFLGYVSVFHYVFKRW